MQPNVDATLRRAALKQLFRDPRFNVMDGLDTYIDDYTKADPIPEELVRKLAHARAIFDPPPTMLTPEGYVVDAPIAPAALAAQADPLPPADTSTSEAESLKPESPASALEYPKQDS